MPNCSDAVSVVIDTHVPALVELRQVLADGLADNFESVEVDVVQCPDLRSAPIGLVSAHFGSGLRIAEVGGPGNLFPNIHKEKQFDLKEVCSTCDASGGSAFGPGAGPWPVVGTNCEMVADVDCKANKVATKIARTVEGDRGYRMETIDSPQFSLMANLAVSQDPDVAVDVVHIKASVRKGALNFPESIRQALAKHFGEHPVSMGGVFVLKKGQARLHVMPDFPGCPWTSEDEISASWLRYFSMSAPLVCCSVLHSYDPGHKLRMEHTHCFSAHGDSGHYHYDTTPEEVEYEGWFAPAEKIYRIDEI